MRGGFRDGKGEMQWSSEIKYKGEWKQGFATGYGKLTLADGGTYEGEWLKDRCHG